MTTALRHSAFRRLLLGLAASQLGDWLYNTALLAYVFERTHSATWLGVTTAARVLPVVVLGPLGGVIADRFDRRRLMVLADLGRAGLMLVLFGAAASGAPVVLVPAVAAAATAVGAAYPACAAACVSRLVPHDELAAANAARAVVGPVCIIAGPALGALVVALSSADVAFVLNAGTFLLSAVAVASLRAGAAFRPAARTETPNVARELREGLAALLAHRLALRLVGADILASLVYGVLSVTLVLVAMRSGMAGGGYGLLLAAIGVGGVIGAAVAPRLTGSPMLVVTGTLTVGAPLVVMSVAPGPVSALICAALTGAGSMVIEIATETVLQRGLDDRVFARAYGFAFPASIAGISLGAVVAAPLIALLGLAGTLALVGAFVVAYAAWLVLSDRATSPVPASL